MSLESAKKQPSTFLLKLLRKIKPPFLRKGLLKYLFKRRGIRLQDLLSFDNDRFFLYKVNNTFIPDESLYWPVDLSSKYEKGKNESMFAYEPKEGDIIVDIGAGLGEETLLYSMLVKDKGKVFAIEASYSAFTILKKTISLNGLSNVNAFNNAIYKYDGSVSLDEGGLSYEDAFVKETSPGTSPAIRSVRMDHFIEEQGIGPIDLLKVNIEGSERFVVDTLNKDQVSLIKNAAIACHDFRYSREQNEFFRTKAHIMDFFKKNGFEVFSRHTGIDYLDDWIYATNKSL